VWSVELELLLTPHSSLLTPHSPLKKAPLQIHEERPSQKPI